MAILTPDLDLLRATVQTQPWGMLYFDKGLANDVTGAVNSRRLSPPRWSTGLQMHNALRRDLMGRWEALLSALDGQINQLALHDIKYPAPAGTLAGTLTLASPVAVGATSMVINASAGQVGATLLPGDRLGIGALQATQVVIVNALCTVDGSNQITVPFRQAARQAHAAAAAVTWNRPVALFRLKAGEWGFERRPGALDGGLGLDLIESWDA